MIAANFFYALNVPTYIYRTQETVKPCDQEKLLGILSGIYDNLQMAFDNNLVELFNLTVGRLAVDCKSRIMDSIKREEELVLFKFVDIYKYIKTCNMYQGNHDKELKQILFTRQ